jgi:hypothetical protein
MADPPWNEFPYHRPGSALLFPRDEGWHRLLPGKVANPALSGMEWVYLNAHLRERGGAGRLFVVFVAYFAQHLRFLVVRAFDAEDRYLFGCSGTAWGLLRASPEHLDMSFLHGGGTDEWSTVLGSGGEPIPFRSRLSAIDDAGAFSVDLETETRKRPYEAAGTGFLPFGTRGWFYYYSLTRLEVRGSLRVPAPGGAMEDVLVEGVGWYDHQWGPFYVTPFRVKDREQYEWMSIQLDSNDEILLTTVWEPTGETPSLPEYGGAGLIRSNGTFASLIGAERWKRTKFWRSPVQHATYAAEWRFEAPEWNTSLLIQTRHPDQLTTILDAPPPSMVAGISAVFEGWTNWFGSFWEGSCKVTGTFDGRPVTGCAFAELVKRYEDPEFRLNVVRDEPGLCVIAWRVQNPDEQVRLRFRFFLERMDGTLLIDLPDLDIPVVSLDDPALPRNEPLIARVVACSADGSISGTDTLEIRLR